MRGPTHSDLHAEIAALRALTETELKNLNKRLSAVESTQSQLVRVATQGKTGLRLFLWLGGGITAAATAWATLWKELGGR